MQLVEITTHAEEPEVSTAVHTADNPYCDDLSCWCHTDEEYHTQVTSVSLEADVDDELLACAVEMLGGAA